MRIDANSGEVNEIAYSVPGLSFAKFGKASSSRRSHWDKVAPFPKSRTPSRACGLGTQGAEAVALLAQRGLNAGAVQIARELLDQLGSIAPANPASLRNPEDQAKVEQAMWDWYLEWGEIARIAISDRRMLKELGFLNAKRPVAEEEDDAPAETAQLSE